MWPSTPALSPVPSLSSSPSPPPTPSHKRQDEEFLKSVLALAIRLPAPIALTEEKMGLHGGGQRPYLSSSGHSSRSSISSTTTVSSLTPLTPSFNKDAGWSQDDPERRSFSSEDNLSRAIAEDLAILEPVEAHYHRQRPWWLFSMIWAHQIWWIITVLGNLPFVLHVARLPPNPARTSVVAQVSLANLAISVLVRNELILAGCYWVSSKVPFRRFYAHRMVHSIGGLHVGCGFATFIWIIFYTVEVGREATLISALDIALFTTALILPMGITVIIVFALRPLRDRFHNAWEYTHRYVGWFVVADLITHLSLKAATLPNPIGLFYTSLPYLTIISVISIFYVWFTVRYSHVSIRANKSVAVITFPGRPTMRSGTFARISRDGIQWHAFSVAMTDLEKREFSLIVARAGDWTTKLITDTLERRGPQKLFIRGVNPPGFMYMHHAYKKVITICTGAGIAPALPHIEQATSNIMLIWIGKNHRKTYGDAVWKAVTSNLPANQLILHDTGTSGRPDIGTLIEKAAKAHDAEAVFVVSNDAYTQLCASICWRKGLRCYGATRDS